MNWSDFRKDLDIALKEVSDKYNVSLEPKTIRYTPSTFSFTVEGVILGEDKNVDRVLFEESCSRYGFAPSDFEKVFKIEGVNYKLVGFNNRARKYKIVLEKENGERVRSTVATLALSIRGSSV